MKLERVQDIFSLTIGTLVTGRDFRDLIEFSKVKGSSHWSGAEYAIGNNPQQGINWVGQPPKLLAVIIRTKLGFGEDAWMDEAKTTYKYSLKANKGKVTLAHRTSQVLIKQPEHSYPVFLFAKSPKSRWRFEGRFSVSSAADTHVILRRGTDSANGPESARSERVNFDIPDSWSLARVRRALEEFFESVISRSNGCCVVCGSSLFGLVDVAHLIPYSIDRKNRANPGNGVCLCKYCHAAFDLRLIAIQPDGVLCIAPSISDKIAKHHFSQILPKQRRAWLVGVDVDILNRTVEEFKNSM